MTCNNSWLLSKMILINIGITTSSLSIVENLKVNTNRGIGKLFSENLWMANHNNIIA